MKEFRRMVTFNYSQIATFKFDNELLRLIAKIQECNMF